MTAGIVARIARLVCMLSSASAILGCVNLVPYRAPEHTLPDRYALLAPIPVSSHETTQWWQLFEDPKLNQLVDRVLTKNLNIKEARERVAEAKAVARREGNTLSGNTNLNANARNTVDTAGFNLSLNLDPFGGERSEANAALQRLNAASFNLKDAQLAVASEVMLAYVDLRFFQQSLVYRMQDLKSRSASLLAVRTLLQNGAATRLDEIRLKALVAENRADIPSLYADIARQKNRIATLLGTVPQQLDVDLKYAGIQPDPKAISDIGIPADLLRRRPDIRAAERNYAAAVSEINVAQAARYPSLTLSGQISAPLEGAAGSTRGVGIGLNIPVFNQTSLAAQVDVSTARANQAYLQWSQLVLSAVADVETALIAVQSSRDEVNAAQTSLRLNLEALQLSQDLYTGSGTVTIIEILDAERAVTSARSTLAVALSSYSTEIIILHTALGIGFDQT